MNMSFGVHFDINQRIDTQAHAQGVLKCKEQNMSKKSVTDNNFTNWPQESIVFCVRTVGKVRL